MFASYASFPNQSRGRRFAEDESHFRTCFQRDRDRIIHASAFRRLKHKTQVFVEHEGDHYRTRLTHSLEVAQVARTIARSLGLNQDLTEAIALAHDLGHTPFGHTGEDALDEVMQPFGGFDHNAQTLRIVTSLERLYADFDGLNLTWEALEGLAKHNGPVTGELPYALVEYQAQHDLELATFASAEAQVAAVSDDIAYNHHDLLDGLRAGLLLPEELRQLPLLSECFQQVDQAYPGLEWRRVRHEALRRFFGMMVEDVIGEANRRLRVLEPQTVQDIRLADQSCVEFSVEFRHKLKKIREYLFVNLYRAPPVVEMRVYVASVVKRLFEYYLMHPEYMPRAWQDELNIYHNQQFIARRVADYLAGMTDRFALQQYKNIC